MGCCENGCFTHFSLLCLGWECGGSKSVFECICPGFGFLKAPGLSRFQICCFSTTTTDNPEVSKDSNIPLDIQCMSNLYVCSFATGQYPQHFPQHRDRLPGPSPARSPGRGPAPEPQRIIRTTSKGLKEIPGLKTGTGVSAGKMMPPETPGGK